jgi:hypothetical protein
MSAVTVESGAAQRAAYGGLVDAIGGIAAGVLAILGMTGLDPEGMAGIATIVLGAAFLIQAAAITTEYADMLQGASVRGAPGTLAGGDGLAAMFMVGAAGLVLGVLALLGIAPATLTAVAVIAFGGALVLSSGSMRQLYMLRALLPVPLTTTPEVLAGQMATGSAGVQLLTGLSAVVLGILAVAGQAPVLLTLVSLLLLGITVLLTGSALSGLVMSFMRPATRSASGTRSLG